MTRGKQLELLFGRLHSDFKMETYLLVLKCNDTDENCNLFENKLNSLIKMYFFVFKMYFFCLSPFYVDPFSKA